MTILSAFAVSASRPVMLSTPIRVPSKIIFIATPQSHLTTLQGFESPVLDEQLNVVTAFIFGCMLSSGTTHPHLLL